MLDDEYYTCHQTIYLPLYFYHKHIMFHFIISPGFCFFFWDSCGGRSSGVFFFCEMGLEKGLFFSRLIHLGFPLFHRAFMCLFLFQECRLFGSSLLYHITSFINNINIFIIIIIIIIIILIFIILIIFIVNIIH